MKAGGVYDKQNGWNMECWVPRERENKKQPSQISTSSLHDLPSGPLRSSRILSKELLALKTAGNAPRLLPSSLLYRVPHWVSMYGTQRCLALKMDRSTVQRPSPVSAKYFRSRKAQLSREEIRERSCLGGGFMQSVRLGSLQLSMPSPPFP